MERLYNFLRAAFTPQLMLGLGIGVSIGFIIAAGFGFGKADAARFIGALFGALIAVSGAIALHYLKEKQIREERRDGLRRLLTTNINYFDILIERPQQFLAAPSETLATIKAQLDRSQRYANRYELEDFRINEAYNILSLVELDIYDLEEIEPHKVAKTVEVFLGVFASHRKVSLGALDLLQGKMPELKGEK